MFSLESSTHEQDAKQLAGLEHKWPSKKSAINTGTNSIKILYVFISFVKKKNSNTQGLRTLTLLGVSRSFNQPTLSSRMIMGKERIVRFLTIYNYQLANSEVS